MCPFIPKPEVGAVLLFSVFACVGFGGDCSRLTTPTDPQIVEATPLTVPRCGLDHLTQVMGLHPHYLQAFLRSQFYLLQVDGPLPLHWRHYIAIMAAARHRCSFLVKMHVQEFYQMGVCVDLVKAGENSWSLAELVHAVVLLVHFHALASFVFGSGIDPHAGGEQEEDGCACDDCGPDPDVNFDNSSPGTEDSLSELEALVERMKELPEEVKRSPASLFTRTAPLQGISDRLVFVGRAGFQEEAESTSVIARFVEDATFGYQSFARHDPPAFCAQEYSWEDHGFPLVNRLYSDIGLLLDEKFRTVCNLTYYSTASHERVDASTLRRALFNYVHCIYGIRYDDYDYGQVNQLLERNLKLYIKTVTCYPERTTHSLYEGYWRQFHHSEKVHVILLLMEARMQAELLYALRAITSFMT
ncbi:hypothetical protein Z043-117323 [Arapaima gigas]